jgi:hypothetical protein
VKTPWEKFSLPGDRPAYARGESAEFRKTLRETFGPLVERVEKWPVGPLEWLMVEVPAEGTLRSWITDLGKRLTPAGSLWIVFPKKPFSRELAFPYSWIDVQKAGLGSGLVDNKIAAFSARLTSIRFVIPVSRRPKA